MKIEENRIGRFSIQMNTIVKEPDNVKAFFNALGFIPVEVTNHFISGNIEYSGYSDKFDIFPIGEIPPEYNINNEKADGDYLNYVEVDNENRIITIK